jgi:hypothetical protein
MGRIKPGQLTDKQRKFAQEYVRDFNATQAAIRAGYSKSSARQAGAVNMKNAVIKSAIADFHHENAKNVNISTERVAEELASVAFARPNGAVSASAKVQALRWLGLHLGMFVEQHRHEHSFDLQDDQQLIRAAIEFGMVDRLPAELRERAEREYPDALPPAES